jgi:hypothetical protein
VIKTHSIEVQPSPRWISQIGLQLILSRKWLSFVRNEYDNREWGSDNKGTGKQIWGMKRYSFLETKRNEKPYKVTGGVNGWSNSVLQGTD